MIIAVIPAKGQSGRLANKNMLPVAGRPMIDYAIADARASKRVQRIVVTTDSDDIAAHCAAQGVEVVRRGTELGGEVPLLDVYRHAVAAIGGNVDTLIGVQPDHPDRTVSLDGALALFEAEGADCLYSIEADGTKNGAHYILSAHFLETGSARRKVGIVDDCTNIHYAEDLAKADQRLRERQGS